MVCYCPKYLEGGDFKVAVSKEVKKERDQAKSNAEFILKRKGLDYDTWLYELHQKVISENVPLLIQELKDKEKSEQTFESN